MARFYMYIRSDEKIFTLDSIFHISSQATKPGGLYFGFMNLRVNSKMIRVQNCSGVASSTVNVAYNQCTYALSKEANIPRS